MKRLRLVRLVVLFSAMMVCPSLLSALRLAVGRAPAATREPRGADRARFATGAKMQSDSNTSSIDPAKAEEAKSISETKSEEIAAVERALAALKKLEKAANEKMTLREYNSKVNDVKAEVSECLRRVSPRELRKEIGLAVEAYADAITAWEEMIRYDFMSADYEPGSSLQKKYSIPTSGDATGRIMARGAVLSTIWKVARKHTDKVSSIIGK
ncbi:MAG: hypothetical protein HY644_15360 [Acidobacteria bacterium]|nr:hypothetical protein [Acidobacteriota bacterium]